MEKGLNLLVTRCFCVFAVFVFKCLVSLLMRIVVLSKLRRV